jgi:hypothetical protein
MTEHTGSASHGHMSEAGDTSTLTLTFPVKKPNATVPVVELFLK